MKIKSLKLLALVVAILIIISSLPIFATAAQTISYSKDSNSGTRGEICTSLSGTSASSYYTGSYTYENLIELSSSNLKTSLHNLMANTHKYTSSYDDCHYKADKTDCENGNGKVTLIYTSYQATMSQWNGWNREHVWPKSLGGNTTSGGGADLHHIRPSDSGVNSSRGNKKYGYAGSGASSKYGTDPAVGVIGGTYNSTYFEPLDEVKGDVARICLYVYVRWGSDWGADSVTEVFESVDVLLEWCELDPVDTWEMGRNEVVQNIQGNRNVFIDYPEYAWLLYGKEVPDDMITPSGSALNGEVPTPPAGGGDEGGNTPDDPVGPSAPTEIPENFVLQNKGTYVTDVANPYTSSSGTVKKQYKMSGNKDEAAVMSLAQNSDGTVSLKYGSKYLLADGTNVEFVDTQSDNTKFILEQTDGGYFIKCATATYNERAQYLEVYNGNLTCYGMGSDASIYTFVFESAEASTDNPGGGEVTDPDDPVTPDDPVIPPVGEDGRVAIFDLGANGGASHSDGTAVASPTSFTSGSYTLTLTNLTKVYSGATDAKGNSCLKIGTSSATGSLTFTVGDDVDKVVIHVAMYKAKTSKLSVNGTEYEIKTSSNDGEYTAITVDTSTTKTVTLTTVGSSTGRCMINTIEFFSTASNPDINDPDNNDPESETTEPDEIESTEPDEIESTEPDEIESTEPDEIESTEPDEIESSDAIEQPVETKPTDKPDESEKQEGSETPSSSGGGCGASAAGGIVVISVLCVGIFTVAYRKKED